MNRTPTVRRQIMRVVPETRSSAREARQVRAGRTCAFTGDDVPRGRAGEDSRTPRP
jgi:hypothetical protein